MELYFLTGNKHKFNEAKFTLEKFGVKLQHINIDKPEIQSDSIEEVSRYSAEKVATELGKPVIVEDTGIFFKAYKNFPGVHTRFIYESIGYEGIMKLLKGKDRHAYFKTVAAYCEPWKKAVLFEGISKGRIAMKPSCLDKDVMPYDRIFIPNDTKKLWCLDLSHKYKTSHRNIAFEKLGSYLTKRL